MGEIFSIPAGTPFLDALARGVLDDTKADALALADTLILLPKIGRAHV